MNCFFFLSLVVFFGLVVCSSSFVATQECYYIYIYMYIYILVTSVFKDISFYQKEIYMGHMKQSWFIIKEVIPNKNKVVSNKGKINQSDEIYDICRKHIFIDVIHVLV